MTISRKDVLEFDENYKSHAFVIGIDQYQGLDANLRTATNDALDIALRLKALQGFDNVYVMNNVGKQQMERLLNWLKRPRGNRFGMANQHFEMELSEKGYDSDVFWLTWENVQGDSTEDETNEIQFEWQKTTDEKEVFTLYKTPISELKIKQDDSLVFYYAGHGFAGEFKNGPVGYLTPTDAQKLLTTSLISMNDVYEALSKVKCKHTLLILDCCFAGKFQFAETGRGDEETYLGPMYARRFNRFKAGAAWQVLTSAGPYQLANDSAEWAGIRHNSPFARALKEALEGNADFSGVFNQGQRHQDGIITATELYLYVWDEVEQITGNVKPQHPSLFPMAQHREGEFMFFNPKIDFNSFKFADNPDKNPYKGLYPYEKEDRHLFFGRKSVIKQVLGRLKNVDILFVSGPSGSGKSSLVKAGVFPRLEVSGYEELIKIRPSDLVSLDENPPTTSPLIDTLKTKLESGNKYLLLIDQYEEVFLHLERESIQQHISELLSIVLSQSSNQREKVISDIIELISNPAEEVLFITNPSRFGTTEVLAQEIIPSLENVHTIIFSPEDLSEEVSEEDNKNHQTKAEEIIAQLESEEPYVLLIEQYESWKKHTEKELLKQEIGKILEAATTHQQKIILSISDDFSLQKAEPTFKRYFQNTRSYALPPKGPLAVFTMRSDFEWQVKKTNLAQHWKRQNIYRIPSLGLDELREIITRPAWWAMYDFKDHEAEVEQDQGETLINEILEDFSNFPSALPLLSFTMYTFYEIARDRRHQLIRADYENILQGMAGALSTKADTIFKVFSEKEQKIMQKIMIRLINFSEGTFSRRKISYRREIGSGTSKNRVSELDFSSENSSISTVIEAMQTANLLVIGGNETGDSFVEPAHHSLITHWDTCRKWLDEFGKDHLLLQRNLWKAVAEYHRHDESEQYLWDANPKLQQVILAILDPLGLLLKEENVDLLSASSLLWNNDVEDENKEKVVDLINWWENQNALIIPPELMFDGDNEIEVNELLDFLIKNASHWLNKLEAEFVLKSWKKRNNRIEQLKKERDNALRKAHANTNALKALELTKTNATLGIRFAELNYHIYPEVDTALGIFRDIYSNSSLSLFKQKYDLRVVGFSPDNIPLYITHDGTTINLLNVQGKHIQNFNYQGTLSFVKVSSKSKYLMHQSTFSVVIWNISTGSEVFRFNHSKQLGSSSFSFNEKYVLISFKTYEGTTPVGFIRLWEIELQKDVWTVETPSYISAFSSNDKFILSGGVDHRESYKVTLRDINGQEKQSYKGHSSIVWEATLSPDGKYILTGSEDKTAKLWDRYSGEELQNYPHGERVGTVSFSPDGQYIMTGSSDMNVRFWNLQGQELKRFQHINGVSWAKFSPDGSTILTRVFINSVTPRGIRSYLWDIEKSLFQNFSEHIEGHTEWVETIDFSFSRPSESKWPFGEGVYFLTGSEDRTAKLWDAKGQLISSFEGDDGHNNNLQTVAFSPNGNFILTGAKDARAKIWRPDGKILKTLNPEIGRVNCLTFSQDSKYIFIGGSQKVKMYDLGEVLGNIEETIIAVTVFKEEEGRENIWSIALSPDDEYQYLLTGSSNVAGGSNRIHKAKLWNRKTGELTQSFAEHTNTVSSLAFSPDGTHFLTGSKDKTAKLWHIQSKKSILTLKGHAYTINKVSFSPDGNYLLTASEDHTIKIWDIHGREVQTLAGFRSGALGNVLAATFSPDGTYIMAGSRGEVKKWLTPWAYLQEKVHAYTIEELKESGLEFTDKDLVQMNKRGKMW